MLDVFKFQVGIDLLLFTGPHVLYFVIYGLVPHILAIWTNGNLLGDKVGEIDIFTFQNFQIVFS